MTTTPRRGAALRNAPVTLPSGEVVPIADACRLLDLDVHAVHGRIGAGWSPEKAIATPTVRTHAEFLKRQAIHRAPGFYEWRTSRR